ncbi:hypothetical protein MY4824_004195 [Beauveria thailandica]
MPSLMMMRLITERLGLAERKLALGSRAVKTSTHFNLGSPSKVYKTTNSISY